MGTDTWGDLIRRSPYGNTDDMRQMADDFDYYDAHPDKVSVHVGLAPGWSPGNPAFRDVHRFDRRALASFVTPHHHGTPRDFADLVPRGGFDDQDIFESRAKLIRHYDGTGEPVFPMPEYGITEEMLQANAGCKYAAAYLHARGFSLAVIADLADDLRAVLDAGLDPHAPEPADGRPRDAFDDVLAALAAGLSTDEIRTGLTTGQWPDGLAVLTALRS